MTITQVITALPDAPDPAIDPPSVFSQKAAASVLAQKGLIPELNVFAEQVNVAASKVNVDAAVASTSATTATNAAALVLAAANVSPWITGMSYQKNQAVISQVNFQTYRRTAAAGISTTDPANDLANWILLYGNDANGAFEAYAVQGQDIDLSKGNYFTLKLSSPTSVNIINCPSSGYSFILEVTSTASGTLTLPSAVRTPSDVPYVLTSNKTHLLMFVTSNGGARWRMTASVNFAI